MMAEQIATEAEAIWPKQEEFLALVKAHGDNPWALDTETDGLDVRGPNSRCTAHYVGLLPIGSRVCCIFTIGQFEAIRSVVEGLNLVGHNLRFDLHALNLRLKRPYVDTMVTAYHRNTTGRRSLDHFAKVYGWPKIKTPDLIKQGRISEMNPHDVAKYLADDCLRTGQLYVITKNRGVFTHDNQVELAVTRMENRGVRLLLPELRILGQEITTKTNEARNKLDLLGAPDNLGSPKQVAVWLQAAGRQLPLTEKGNPSTGKLVLQQLAEKGDDYAELLLSWRKLTKLTQAFINPLPKMARHGMLYPSVNTTRTKTGRFSYSDPNLQQIPKRGPMAKKFRYCFTGESAGVSGADFSQVELRVAAALAQEPVLLEAFAAGRDPHTEVAAQMLGKRPEEITPEERYGAKAVNFGILNGMGASRLSTELRSDLNTAHHFLSNYKRSLHRLNEWMEGIWRDAERDQVARTVAGRTRFFSSSEATRPAISVIVQGGAAELMREALVAVDEAGLKPILVVHDEIIVDGLDKGDEVATIMQEAANHAYPEVFGAVDFPAEGGSGPTWGHV